MRKSPLLTVSLRRKVDLHFTDYAGKMYVLDEKRRRLSELNEMGSYIWKSLRQKITYVVIVKHVLSEFDVSSDQKNKVKKEIFEFLDSLYKKNLLEVIKK